MVKMLGKRLDVTRHATRHSAKSCLVSSVSQNKSIPSADVHSFLRCGPSLKVAIRSLLLQEEMVFMLGLHATMFARRFLKLPHLRHLELLTKPVAHRNIIALMYRSAGRNLRVMSIATIFCNDVQTRG